MEGQGGKGEGKEAQKERPKRMPYTVFLDAEDIAFLQERGAETGLSFSSMVRRAVKEWIRREKERQRKGEAQD